MIINHNLSAMNTQRASKINNWGSAKNIAALSSGMRINKAGGRCIRFGCFRKNAFPDKRFEPGIKKCIRRYFFYPDSRGFPSGNNRCSSETERTCSPVFHGIYTSEDRMQIQVEVSQLVDELDRVASHAQFNGLNMLTGRFAASTGENSVTGSMWLHIGANMDQREQVFIGTMTSSALGVRQVSTGNIMSISTPEQANRNIGVWIRLLKLLTNREQTSVPIRTDLKWQ